MKKLMYLVIFLPLFLLAQIKGDTIVSKQSLVEINQRIQKLEKNVDDGKSSLENAKSMIEISKNYSNSADGLMSRITWFIAILISILGGGGAIGLWITIKKSTKDLLSKNDKIINDKLKTILTDKENLIIELIDKHRVEKELLLKSRILVLNKVETDLNENLMKVLNEYCKSLSFEKDIVDIKQYKFKNNKYDLVLLDNTNIENSDKDWDFKTQDLSGILPNLVESICKKGIAFLYFGNDKNDGMFSKDPKLNNYLHLINFSNSPSTAYTNIINLLNFRELLKKS